MRIHFIAIGGAIMHQMAIALKNKGHHVTGSDDVINEPSKSNLEKNGLFPSKLGFHAEHIQTDIDEIVLGMHAKLDNPELARAMELGIKVYSFPEYVYKNSMDKTRIVVAGSHGKTSITSMIMHVLKSLNFEFDYLVGSSVKGFEHSVKLSDAPIIVIEGDEYLSSCLSNEPKFINYKGNIAILSGIEWDHINVFKTEAIYFEQFKKLVHSLDHQAKLFYYNDTQIAETVLSIRNDVEKQSYQSPDFSIENHKYIISFEGKKYEFDFFGKHNMENMEAAHCVCRTLEINSHLFYQAMQSFSGAGRRLEKIYDSNECVIFRDFAHSPSKLRATIKAVSDTYSDYKIVACYELHTFSSLNKDFLPQYKDTFGQVDIPIVYMDKVTVEQKGNQVFTSEEILNEFNRNDILYLNEKNDLLKTLKSFDTSKTVFLMMSSGNFSGLDLLQIIEKENDNPKIEEKKSEYFNTLLSQNKEVNSPFESKFLKFESKKTILLMYSLSIFSSIVAPFIFYKRIPKNDACYNLIVQNFHFQTLIIIGYLIALLLIWADYSFTGKLILLLSFIYNILKLRDAKNAVLENKAVNLPVGILVFPYNEEINR
jgi:UDP-N-acetylmuramate: L-alanyl-gamma-D-glutamyl-meso-diaminopimelate ligase